MTITIEPGIYIKDKFGVRIEDSVIVKNQENGSIMNLNAFTKELLVLG
jgi:Xaa-Pro aminopeptidase